VRTVLVAGYARTVFILDVSASMQATDVSGSRFAAAKAAARSAAAKLRPGQQAMLIAAGQDAQVVVPFSEDPGAIQRGLDRLTALDVPGRLSEALRLAQANLQVQGGPAAVEVFTDGAFEAPSLPDLGGATVHWHHTGQRGKNVGITAFEARKTFFGAFDYQAFLSVPLLARGEVIGVINVHHREAHDHTPDEVALMSFIGEQMGGVIAAARPPGLPAPRMFLRFGEPGV